MPPKKQANNAKPVRKKSNVRAMRAGGKLFQYSEYQMHSALEELRNKKASIREVARKFNVPRATLTEKFKGLRPVEHTMGPKTMLPREIENKIVKCLFTLAEAGFPITKQQLLDNVYDLVSKQGGTSDIRRPGDKWLKLFKKKTCCKRTKEPTVIALKRTC